MVMLSQMIPPSGTTGFLTPKTSLLLCSKVVPRAGVSKERQDMLEKGWREGGADMFLVSCPVPELTSR